MVVEKSKQTVERWLTGKSISDAQRPDQIPESDLPPRTSTEINNFCESPKIDRRKLVSQFYSSSSTSSRSSRRKRSKPEVQKSKFPKEGKSMKSSKLSISSSEFEEEYLESELGYLKPSVIDGNIIEYHMNEKAPFSLEMFYILPIGDSIQAEVVELANLSANLEKHFSRRPQPKTWRNILAILPIGTYLAVDLKDEVRFLGFSLFSCVAYSMF
jgi:hypothetical protein